MSLRHKKDIQDNRKKTEALEIDISILKSAVEKILLHIQEIQGEIDDIKEQGKRRPGRPRKVQEISQDSPN